MSSSQKISGLGPRIFFYPSLWCLKIIGVFYNHIILLIYVAMKQFVDQDLYWNLNSLTKPKLMCPE